MSAPIPATSVRDPRLPGPAGTAGFALLTVIFFVFALTILSLSLFSLSRFESRFFQPSQDHTEAVQAARGGVDWVRYVLQSTGSLDPVHDPAVTRPPLIEYAVARRGAGDFAGSTDSTGFVYEPPYDPIWIRVVAAKNGQRHAVLARYQPHDGSRLYKRLITAMDYVRVDSAAFGDPNPPVGSGDRFDQVQFYGEVSTPVWRSDHTGSHPGSPRPLYNPYSIDGNWCATDLTLPRPEEDVEGAWWDQRYATALSLPINLFVQLTAPDETPVYFKTHRDADPPDAGGREWSVRLQPAECQILVAGTCVWLLRDGLRAEGTLRIQSISPDIPATLILVARPGPGPDDAAEHDVGFAFLGGIQVDANVRLFLVTSGGVGIEHIHQEVEGNGYAKYLSIYADWVRIQGPWLGSPPNALRLEHGPSCAGGALEDVPNGLVDQLIQRDLLPNSRFARRKMTFDRDTWMETALGPGN